MVVESSCHIIVPPLKVRERLNITWRLGGGRGVWPNRHITFVVAKKLNLQFTLLYLRYTWRDGLVENIIKWGGGGWLKTSEYRHMGKERGSKIAQKPSYDIWMFLYR